MPQSDVAKWMCVCAAVAFLVAPTNCTIKFRRVPPESICLIEYFFICNHAGDSVSAQDFSPAPYIFDISVIVSRLFRVY